MTNLKQFSDEFDALYSGENNPWIGHYGACQAVAHASWRILGKCQFYRMQEEATGKQVMTG